MTSDGPDWPVEVIRSRRRKKTVSAELRAGTLIVRAPAGMSDAALRPFITKFKRRLGKRVQPAVETDDDLHERAQALNKKYFDGRFSWQSITYVDNQQKRHGSCTPVHGTIRLSRRLARLPEWVLDYVIVHEMCHLEISGHGDDFWALVNHYPLTERARGFLSAVDMMAALGHDDIFA